MLLAIYMYCGCTDRLVLDLSETSKTFFHNHALSGIIIFLRIYLPELSVDESHDRSQLKYKMSRLMGKPTTCIGENKDADQLHGNREADQRLCFRYSDSTIPLLLKSEISSF